MRKLAVAAACAAALAAPALARAGDVAMRVQEVPLGARALAAAVRPMHFNMFAPHWIGGGTVTFRTHRLHGGWTRWLAADADVSPDGGTGRWHDGDLVWTGASDAVQFRTRGAVTRLRAYELWSRVLKTQPRALASAAQPAIVTRKQWGANEKIVRAKPVIAKTLRLAIVHHTAGTNDYTPEQAAAVVRGIETYHVQGNGWNDIGYNFLVDRFGTIYEGRAGGITKNVIGAHAEGFNTGSVGIALIGNFSTATPPKAQQDALVKLLAWRLDVAHVDPLSTVAVTSGGNFKFKAGKVVTLRAISGHRDTGPSECPGNSAYALLPGIAKRVAATGLPKLYSPTVVGTLGGPVRFQARLSKSLAWAVTVTNVRGQAVAHGSGTSSEIDWTWHSPAGKGAYAWTMAAPGVLAASGTIGGAVPPPPPPPPPPPATFTLTGLAASASVVTPAPDGSGGTATVSFTISAPARVTAQLVDANGAVALTALDEQRPAGANTFTLDVTSVPDGRYTLQVAGQPETGSPATASLPIVVDRSISGITVTAPPGGPVTLAFTLPQPVGVHIEVQKKGIVQATLYDGTLGTGAHTLDWDGTDPAGNPLPAGQYAIAITFTDALGPVTIVLPFALAQ